MPKITVDDRTLEVPEGQTILQALDAAGLLMNGVEIRRLARTALEPL